MSNNLGALQGTLIAQRSLEILHERFPAIGLIATDFSDEGVSFGQTVTSRIVTVGAAQQYTKVSGFAPQDLNTTDVNVTIDQFPYSAFELYPTDLAGTKRNLVEDYAKKVAVEIGNSIYASLGALFVSGNFANATTQAVAGATRVNTIVKANTALNKRNVNDERFGLYNSDLYGQLWADDSLVKLTYDADGITVNKLPQVHGVTLAEYRSMPTTGNLIGVQGAKDGLVIATRLPSNPADIVPGLPSVSVVQNVVHPDLGISMQVRIFEDPKKGSLNYVACLMFGVAVGNPVSIQRIVSA